MANKNVGTGKAVTIGTVLLGGTDAGNYTVTDASGATVSITPRPITSTGIQGVDRTYNGSTTVALNTASASLNNTIAGDNLSLVSTSATGTMADKNAGSAKAVAVTGLGLGGTDAGNYSLTDASNATVNIAKLVVSSTGITATDKVFDGTTTVALNTAGASLVGVSGDTVGVNATGAGNVATPDPGAAEPVTVSGIALTGPDAIDYSVSPTPIAPGGGPLTVRILSVSDGRFDDVRFKEYLWALAMRRSRSAARCSKPCSPASARKTSASSCSAAWCSRPAWRRRRSTSSSPPRRRSPARRPGANLSCGR